MQSSRFLYASQIREILASGRKAEIQCLSAIHPTFLTDLYLPSRIQECLAGVSSAGGAGTQRCAPGQQADGPAAPRDGPLTPAPRGAASREPLQ